MPFGETQCITLASKLKALRSLGRQSSLAKPMSESTVRGTCTFICFVMKAIAVLHWAAVAVQAVGSRLPAESVNEVLMIRLSAGKFRFTNSKLLKKNNLFFTMGPPSVPPAWCRHSGGLNPSA